MAANPPNPASRPHRLVWIGAAIAALVVLGVLALLVAREWGSDDSTAVTTVTVTTVTATTVTATTATVTSVLSGSGIAASESRTVPAFTAVELAGANTVTVQVGGAQSVVVSGDDNLLARVTTEVTDGTLTIGSEGSFETVTPLRVEITVPVLEAATLAGSGEVTVAGVQGPSFDARLRGSGIVTVSGTTDRLDAGLSGTGSLRLDDLVARRATAVVSGAGELRVHATESLDASVTGVGEVVYSGNPADLTQRVTGTGAIRPQ